MAWRRVGETWWLEEALKELDEWVLKRIRKLSIMAGGGGSVWRCGGGATEKGGINQGSSHIQRAQLWLEGDNEGLFPLRGRRLEGPDVDLGMVREGKTRNCKALGRLRREGSPAVG